MRRILSTAFIIGNQVLTIFISRRWVLPRFSLLQQISLFPFYKLRRVELTVTHLQFTVANCKKFKLNKKISGYPDLCFIVCGREWKHRSLFKLDSTFLYPEILYSNFRLPMNIRRMCIEIDPLLNRRAAARNVYLLPSSRKVIHFKKGIRIRN